MHHSKRTRALAAMMAVAITSPAVAIGDDKSPLRTDTKDVPRIDIDQLLDVTVRRSPALARARNDVRIAEGEEQSAAGIDDIRANAGAQVSRNDRAVVEGQPTQVVGDEKVSLSFGLSRNLPTGGNLELSVNGARIKEEHRVEPQVSMGQDPTTSNVRAVQAQGRATLQHPLLRGLGRDIARADRKQASLRRTAAELRAEVAAGELTRDVIKGYWELAHAALSLEARKASLENGHKLYKEAKAAVRMGARPPGDLKAAEYALAVREERVLLAEIQLEQQSLSLRQIAGLEIGPNAIALWPKVFPKVAKKRYSVASRVKRGLRRNPALAALRQDVKGAEISVRVAKDATRPRLDFTLSGGVSGSGRNFDQMTSNLSNVEVSAGLQFSFDVGNNTAKGGYKAARGRMRTIRVDAEELRRQIASAIVLAVHRIDAARTRVQVSTKAIELAKANLEAERARFRVGRSSSTQVFERQDEIDDARLTRARALADYHQAVAELMTLTGDILKRYGVELITD